MAVLLRFADPRGLRDLATFLGRAARIEESEVRLQLLGGVLAAWVPVLRPQTILDASPLVLGMRAIPASAEPSPGGGDGLDVLVPLRGVLDRLARDRPEGSTTLPVPPERLMAAWAAISPPRSGWRAAGRVDEALLMQAARAGIERVARAVPEGLGTPLVERVRTETWTEPLHLEGADPQAVPVAGTAFAAQALGFLAANTQDEIAYAKLALAPGWLRVTTQRGHVLQRLRRHD